MTWSRLNTDPGGDKNTLKQSWIQGDTSLDMR